MKTMHDLQSSPTVFLQGFRPSWVFVFLITFFLTPFPVWAQGMKKVSFPFSPIGLNCLPWFVANDARIFEDT